jgi:hypothetical protein
MSMTRVGPTAGADKALRLARAGVVAVFGLVALYDVGHGAYLLTAERPWLAHGDDTLWAALGRSAELDAAGSLAVESMLRRMGAFQVLAGAVTATFLWLGRRETRAIDAMLLVYLLVGGAFAWSDRRYFAGTDYALVKAVVSVATTAAMAGWWWARWSRWRRERAVVPA